MPSYLNTTPDLDENESILEQYPAETYVIERGDPDGGDSTFRFHAPARDPVEFDDAERALLFAELYTVVDGFRINGTGERGIPVSVAISSPAAISAYMYAAWGSTPTQISQTINSDRQTVLNHLDQINDKAEELLEEWDETDAPPGEIT